MKQEWPTYLKSIGKNKALAATLSDTEPETESDDSDDKGILSAFTAIVYPTKGITEIVDDEKDLMESKFEKMDEQDDIHTTYAKLYKVSEKHEKLYRLASKKLSNVELDREELFTEKLKAKLFQVKAQLERTSSAKLNEIISFQKATSNKIGLGYDFSSPNIASSSTTVFVSPIDNVNFENNESKIEVASENLDNGKSILEAPPKVGKKEIRNPRNKKDNNKNSQQKKPHFCQYYGASGHTRPNCYKWLVTQQSNSMVSSGN